MSKTETFSNSVDLDVINSYGKGSVRQISTVVRDVYNVASRRFLSNGTIYTFRWSRFRSLYFGKYKFYEGHHFFFQNISNLLYISKMEQKIQKKFFFFWYNCIWIGIVKLSLLRRGYFSSAANVLTRSTKILYVNNRYFFLVNWVGSDQWIW